MNDTEMLREKYGDKIMFSLAPPMLPQNATEAEMDDAAKAFVDKYVPTFQQKPFIMFSFMTPPQFTSAIYKYSRIALSK